MGSALQHMALSMYESAAQAHAVNEWFGRRLGAFVATVELRAEFGIWFAETGVDGHLAVWGRPADLQLSITDVVSS